MTECEQAVCIGWQRVIGKRLSAFTLIELMAVVTVILGLAAMTIMIADYVSTATATSRAKADIAEIEGALESYRLEMGAYPTSSLYRSTYMAPNYVTGPLNANALTNAWLLYQQLTNGPRPYIKFNRHQLSTATNLMTGAGCAFVCDPYGHPYGYFCVRPPATNQANKSSFDLWSFGHDGQSGTAAQNLDDITNWK